MIVRIVVVGVGLTVLGDQVEAMSRTRNGRPRSRDCSNSIRLLVRRKIL